MEHFEKVIKVMNQAAVYVPADDEAIRINGCDYDRGVMFGVGEESGNDYTVLFENVDLENDMFYKLVLID